ncbi:homeobox protein knotted-1-like 3 isoform X2 [Diospyros lotus]|uniref:homeobox protein knotted-1-like 3 isoform X2 n=1 Tax=Diospyros lotus TaxID=55363 RepID=UPI00225B1A5A|nr:homeobox protein knotted-1-like 3 isoform X2 [Diospyros lotus]
MAFPNHLSQEMALQHFTGQHLGENTSVLRSILPEQLGQSSPDGAGKEHKEIQRLILESAAGKAAEHHHQPQQVGVGPTWLNSAILRQHGQNFLNLQTATDATTSQASNQWLSRSIHVNDVREDVQVSNDSMIAARISHESADLNNNKVENGGGGCGGELAGTDVGGGDGILNWQNAKYKAEILSHPLYEQLLSAHVACLRIATPVDQLPRIDAQLAQSQHVVAKYSALGGPTSIGNDKELDQFMTHYVLLLCSFKEQLQQHVRVHAMEAVMACWEIEQSLQSLTGISPGEGTGATMSDDDDDQVDSDTNLFDANLDGPDSMNFGPLIPTESERSLMERVRQELKHELKEGYKEKIVDIREEILRKRRAGKLPGDTTSVLKAWWQSHSKWPYPTEEDKARLVQETGLQLKQINNWFINQRKRNWHSNPSTSTVLKSKRKR